jgi:5-methylcytosine-specific restriction endonuclease McrA
MMELHHQPDHELLSNVTKLIGSHRAITAKLAEYLAEIEDRRLHLKAGFPSLFAFCVRELGLGETEAFRRIVAARLGRRFPIVYSLLASGKVHLSALELLREWLTDENHLELLDAAAGKTKREVEELLAARVPRPDVPARIHQMPNSGPACSAAQASPGPGFEVQPPGSPEQRQERRPRVEPLSADRCRVEFTASAEFREKLERCRDLLSHANPSRDIRIVIERAVDVLLADLERKRLARPKRAPRKRATAKTNAARITNATRRQVYERDGLQCTYVSPEGRRCDARAFLELDHAEPRALGGSSEAENLRVRCRAHNQLWAEEAFGREHVERRRHFRQRKWKRAEEAKRCETVKAHSSETSSLGLFDKVHLALTTMGFREAQARHAVDHVQRLHPESLSAEQALREAVLVATAKCA